MWDLCVTWQWHPSCEALMGKGVTGRDLHCTALVVQPRIQAVTAVSARVRSHNQSGVKHRYSYKPTTACLYSSKSFRCSICFTCSYTSCTTPLNALTK